MVALKTAFKIGLSCLGLLLTAVPTLAQNPPLTFFEPVTGQIESGGTQLWTFSAPDGAVLSFHITAETGDLDPAFTISDTSGNQLIANDDYNYPDTSNALLEAITIPRTATYNLIVRGVNDTSGDYILTMTPGYSQVAASENFNGDLTWTGTEPLEVTTQDGQLNLSLTGTELTGIAVGEDSLTQDDYYAQVHILNVTSEGGWMIGMTARQQGDDYYLLNINNQGQWRFSLESSGGSQVLRDWTPHPAIVAGSTDFTLGMLVNGSGYDFFYNGQFVGRVNDASLTGTGSVGLGVQTTNTLTSQVTATFDDLNVTAPFLVDDAPIIPEQIILGTPQNIAQSLQRTLLIPAGGDMALNVAESFVESRRPGVERVMLGRGTTYENFAIGATISWQAASAGVTGCGLIFRAADDTHYTLAYLDQNGGYGISQRDGESFLPGLFGENAIVDGQSRHLLVIARGDQIIYYVNGHYVGTVDNPAIDGAVGNAVVNFEPISTSCQFTDTWVWRWDASS